MSVQEQELRLSLGSGPVGLDDRPDRLEVITSADPHPLHERHVLVVGINYAPEPTGVAPYTVAMAEQFAAQAASVTVLTGVPHYPSWTIDGGYRRRLRWREGTLLDDGSGILVRRLRHYVPRSQSALTRATYEATFLVNAWATKVNPRPSLIVAVTPSLGGAVAGARLAQRHGSRLLVVVQDLMAKAACQSGISGGGRVSTATATLEAYALRRADRVAVVSDAFRGQLREYGIADDKIVDLPNWTHISPTPLTRRAAREALGWPTAPFTVVHTGNIGLKQDLGNLVEAARLCADDANLRFVIVGAGSQRATVEGQARGIANLEFVDPLDKARYPLSLGAADVLVVNERPGVGDMSLPSKLTSYLSSGRPIIAAIADGGATAAELCRAGGAALIAPSGDPAALAAGVRRLRDDAALRSGLAAAGRRYAETVLSRTAAMARLDDVVAGCLAGA